MRRNGLVIIPSWEYSLSFARSGGKGGQHVNKVSTKVTIRWDVRASRVVNEDQKKRLKQVLGKRVDSRGVLSLSEDGTRSQERNRVTLLKRFMKLVNDSIKKPTPRIKTKIPKSKNQHRLTTKKKVADKKSFRRKINY